MKVLITGSSGLVGTALTAYLLKGGHTIAKLSREPSDLQSNRYNWIPEAGKIDSAGLEGMDAVVHLAGENISNGRWMEEKKSRIRHSRIAGTRFLCRSLTALKNPPKTVISASAIGYYGNRGSEILTEKSAAGEGFLAEVCSEWETALEICREKEIRIVSLRIGLVLTDKGGALDKMLLPFRMGIGGIIGSGKQYMSWIALEDLVRIIDFCIINNTIAGPVNAVTPNPVTNREFTQALAGVLKRPALFVMPGFAIRLVLGEMADELLLSSMRVNPEVLTNNGFNFHHVDISGALESILRKK